MLGNLTGWHLVVIAGVPLVVVVVVVAVIVIAVRLSRRNTPQWAKASVDPTGQLQLLAQLRDEGLLSNEEYEAKRAEVLSRN
ncbi:SHOCT domain-containing protein [Mycetocola zhadangensis]|uniref:SHOCT domain-containing protein n=1 Tax=Mycetocola zhadangensis TaxID=1164595 RepID=A0A3L7J904_9MICO|nr:SHOCT domain-containing protein [Mycetocola zhadangensis]RLQ85941.1 SHOCT domain-containing protein [Mycetocola zhadangensis]GGE87114.1 hypothetical protein GCM10011313_07060 [Mycetocola zhadangensis]